MQAGILALAPETGDVDVQTFLATLIAILVVAKLFGEVAERFGQPAVLGELAAGIVLGPSVLGLVDPGLEMVRLMAEVGVIILLFEIGLETDLRRLLRVGAASSVVAVTGVVLPFGLGYGVAVLFGLGILPSIVVAAALTATSVGITARVLSDLGRLDEPESQIVLGAAVIDDVIGLIILGIVAELVKGDAVTLGSVGRSTLFAFGFLAAALLVGRVVAPRLFGLLARVGRLDTLAAMALVLAFLLAWLADAAGSAMIIGAFAAGVILQPTPQARPVEEGVIALGHFFVPIFFVSVGAAVDVRTFADPFVLSLGGTLIVVAIVGKFVAGLTPFWLDVRRRVIGMGMVPRGEVGLIFANTGLAAGVLDPGLFAALTLMVMVTTFVAPPTLKSMLPPSPRGPDAREGVAEMVTEA